MTYVWFFCQIILYTLGAVVICGLVVHACEMLSLRLMGGAGRVVVKITSMIGTPVHELGHAVMCLLFGHRITAMSLWQPNDAEGTMGYVTHSYHPRNLYHQIGNLFIGIGPVFSGLGILTLTLAFCFPQTLDAYVSTALVMVKNGQGGLSVVWEGLKMIPRMMAEFSVPDVPVWAKIIGLFVLLSVSLHINLSPEDIKGALRAIPVYLILVLVVTVTASLLGSSAMAAVTGALALFNAYTLAMFVIVLVFVALHVCLAMVVWMLRKLLGR